MGILKTIISKIASWFKSEAAAVESDVFADASEIGSALLARVNKIEALVHMNGMAIAAETAARLSAGPNISVPIVEATITTPGVTMNDINTAIQIALAIKAIDPTLSADAVQAATNAALSAAYPAPAAAAPAPVPAA
ncbi:hypothetical protein [Burkholderia vietnamiensis]|uniref:hypothetical protein n=1 Tax=Burkholderia vietnamiensis TaxID=60552 RepID=UPI001CF312D2|nr:hypothetical protein [Burkholderia vietnamiensis]MCA7945583.1 hypothetical protein [Burkholderia vietnamiensis]